MTDYLKLKPRTVFLSELDWRYKETISSLAMDIRAANFQRLVERTGYALGKIEANGKRKPLEQLFMAADREICHLTTP